MLSLAVFEDGNVVLTDGDHRATSDVRRKATAQAIMRPQLVEGMAFVLTLWGAGVVKMRAFRSLAKAKDWFISGLHFPPGSIRMRPQRTSCVAVSVFSDRLVCTPTDQRQPTFFIKTKSMTSTLAFDVESGNVRINVGQLTYNGIPVVNDQNVLFEDCSQYLQTEESMVGSSIWSVNPNPLSLCHVPDLLLSPGLVLNVFVTGTKKVKDTGAYLRLWLLTTDQQNLTPMPSHVGGNFLRANLSTTEEWYVHVQVNEVLVLNRVGNTVLDAIPVATDITKMILAFELYKVSLSVTKPEGTQLNEASNLCLSIPSESPPKPHHKKTRQGNSQTAAFNAKTGSSLNQYLTPRPVAYPFDKDDQAERNSTLIDASVTGACQEVNADQRLLSTNHQDGHHQSLTKILSHNGLSKAPDTSLRANIKPLILEQSANHVQNSHDEDASLTQLQTLQEIDVRPLGTKFSSSMKPIAKIVGRHRSSEERKARRPNSSPEARATPHYAVRIEKNYSAQHGSVSSSDAAVKDDYVDLVASEQTRAPTDGAVIRLSAYEMNDVFHQTDVKTV